MSDATMSDATESKDQSHRFVSRQEWLRAREALLAEEKAATQARDRLAERRRALPMQRVSEGYRFMTEGGECGLAELFAGHDQLLIYHFMFGADWKSPCPSCSFWADSFSGLAPHLAARGVRFLAVSRAPLLRLLECRRENGWQFDWATSIGPEFGRDFGTFFDGEEDGQEDQGYNYGDARPSGEMPGLSAFRKTPGGAIGHCYSTYARGLEPFNAAYQLLDLAPKGRDEAGLPWTMAWLRRPSEYETA